MIVFVDLSYFVFHRFFAMKRWCQLAKKTFDTQDEKLEKFAKLFEDNIVAFKKKHKFEWNRLFFVRDCQKERIWRMKLYGEYKKNREDRNLDFDPTVFTHTYEVIIPHMLQKYGMHMIGYDCAEADDVVAVLHNYIRKNQPERSILILTNDNDYVQLADKHTTIVNCNKADLCARTSEDALSCFALWKVIKGDESDNIPSIEKKIGDKAALKLAQSPELLAAKLASSHEVAAQFNLNKKLIDFEEIPADIRSGIEAKFGNVVLG